MLRRTTVSQLKEKGMLLAYRIVIIFTVVAFSLMGSIPVYAQNNQILNLTAPGAMVSMSSAYTPAIITGMTVYPENPLQFDFMIDVGDDHLEGEALRKESQKLINYFMASLTVPENEMWVNLSPYEKDRIIPQEFGQTEMGRDLLAQDYLLKQLTASAMYPKEDIGEMFWEKIYDKAQERYGTRDVEEKG